MIFLKPSFWTDTAVRAIKTFAQSAVALLSANSIGLLAVDWVNLLSVAGLAAAVSVLTSVASADTVGATEYPEAWTNNTNAAGKQFNP